MEKTSGFHLYVNVKNMDTIIKGDEEKNDDLKRSIHRLHTYFCGLTKAVKKYDGIIEKFTNGRCHIFAEQGENETDGKYKERINDLLVATMYFTDEIFNGIPKYNSYENFKIQAGMDFGDFYKYDIDGMDEFTTIGAVANVAAKLTGFCPTSEIYITADARNKLDSRDKELFTQLDKDKEAEIQEVLKGSPSIYHAKYKALVKRDLVESFLETLKDDTSTFANSVNLTEIEFEEARTKIDFSRLSLKKNKQITAGLLFADIRGFTKLFNISGNNLDALTTVLSSIYENLNKAVETQEGVRVQFQGDRIVAVFNKITGQSKDEVIRLFEAALAIKDCVSKINEEYEGELNGKTIKIGIGLSYGEYYATSLGTRNYKDRLVLGATAMAGDIAEDRYAMDGDIVLSQEYQKRIKKIADDGCIEGIVIVDDSKAISKTGFYKTSMNQATYEKEKEDVLFELQTAQEERKNKIAMPGVFGLNGQQECYVRPHRKY